jgi:hypothetical protein
VLDAQLGGTSAGRRDENSKAITDLPVEDHLHLAHQCPHGPGALDEAARTVATAVGTVAYNAILDWPFDPVANPCPTRLVA